jgi:hypothetical protein
LQGAYQSSGTGEEFALQGLVELSDFNQDFEVEAPQEAEDLTVHAISRELDLNSLSE